MNYIKSLYSSSPSISIKLDKNKHNFFQYITNTHTFYFPTYFLINFYFSYFIFSSRSILRIKQRLTRFVIPYFIWPFLFLGIKIILIMAISLSYYIISMLLENNQKNDFLVFDTINDSMIGILKSTYDEFILIKKEIQNFELKLNNCEIKDYSNLYKMNVKTISEIKIPSFGNDIMRITSDFGFGGQALNNFTTLFEENITKCLEEVYPDYLTNFKDI